MTCVICRNPMLKGETRASEIVVWQGHGRSFRRTTTGRIAHITCLEGKQYDENQMTLDDVLSKEE
jgi:hypothetical protein